MCEGMGGGFGASQTESIGEEGDGQVFNADTTGLTLDEPTEEQEHCSVSHRLHVD